MMTFGFEPKNENFDVSELKRKKTLLNGQIANSNKPLAVIITASKDPNYVFRKGKGYFLANRQLLLSNGFEVIEIEDVRDPKDIEAIVSNIPPGKIKLFYMRAHGAPKQMEFSDQANLSSKEVKNVFHWLPDKLDDNATVYLESCLTGNLEKDFYNNMQFSFGKLTQTMPFVKIVAPSESSYIDRFTINNDGSFSFISRDKYNPTNTIRILDNAVKDLLIKNQDNEITPELSKILLASLKTGEKYFTSGYSSTYLDACGLYHFDAMLYAIKEKNVDAVKELLTLFQTSPNRGPAEKPYETPDMFFPLNAAIAAKNLEILDFLLEKGADIFMEHKGVTPLSFLMERMYDSSDTFFLNAIRSFERSVINNRPLLEKFNSEREQYRKLRSGIPSSRGPFR